MRAFALPRWVWMTAVVLFIIGCALFVFRLGNQASAGVALDDPVVWIEDGSRGSILQVNGSTREVTARVQVGERGDSIIALPATGRDAVFLNRTSGELGVIGAISLRVDNITTLEPSSGLMTGEQLRLVGDLSVSTDAYVIDDERTVVVEPGAGIRFPIPTPGGLGDTAIDFEGRLLAITSDSQQVGIADERGLVPYVALAEPIAGSEQPPQLARTGDEVFVVDTDRRRINQIVDDGSVGAATCVAGSLSNVLVGGSHLTTSDGTMRVLVHDPAKRVLSVSEPQTSECFEIEIDVEGEVFGEPVAVDGTAYLPNFDTGRVEIVDLIERIPIDSVLFSTVPGRPFELEVFDNAVWANEPQGASAAIITRQGLARLTKINRVVIQAPGAEDGEFGSAVVERDDAGDTRVFGDQGDNIGGVPGAQPEVGGGEGEAAGEGGSGGVTGEETGLGEPLDDPFGIVVDAIEEVEALDQLLANFQFSADTVNVGEEVRFTDDSSGSPISWNWDFGDGTGADGPEVTNVWDQDGIYTVTLFISDALGNQAQQSTEITIVAIDVQPPPVANFTFTSETVEVGEQLELESLSTGDPETLIWTMGDGTQLTGQVIDHRYGEVGSFTVTLTATNSAGSDSTEATITVVEAVRPPDAKIGAHLRIVETGQSVTLVSESTNSPTAISWEFGDNTSALGREVRKSWSSPGTYRIRLSVSNSAGESTTFDDIVVRARVDPPVARFGQSALETIVGEPLSFNDLSLNNPTRLAWEFGDGATSSGANVSHVWDEEGTYAVTLTAGNEAGSDDASKTVTVRLPPPDPPTASFSVSSATVPVNAVVAFTDTSTGDPSKWSWDFGDGTKSTAQNPPHAFAEPGTYEVELTAENAGGSSKVVKTIIVSDPPVAAFTFVADELDVALADTSTNEPTSWSWDFGDGTTSTAQNPTKVFVARGTYEVTLIASNSGGASAPKVISITVAVAAEARFRSETTGLTVVFEDTSLHHPTTWLWDFGDGTTSTSQNPTHTYAAPGMYNVVFTVSNIAGSSGPPRFRTLNVQGAPPVASFSCQIVGAGVACDGSTSSGAVSWSWSAPGAATSTGLTTATPSFTYDTSGLKDITLVVTSQSGLTDTTTQQIGPITVPQPPTITSLVVVSNTNGVVELAATATESPTSWSWTAPGATFLSGDTTGNPVLSYSTEGSKTVTATAVNAVGSSNFEAETFTVDLVTPPVVQLVSETSNSGGVVVLQGVATNSPTSWNWPATLGAGATLTGGAGTSTPTYTVTANGPYSGVVTASNGDGPGPSFGFSFTVSDIPPPPTPPVVQLVSETSNSGGVVVLQGVATNSPTSWNWPATLGAGATLTGGAGTSTPTYTVTANGPYSGVVTASNGDGPGPSFGFSFTVSDLPVPP